MRNLCCHRLFCHAISWVTLFVAASEGLRAQDCTPEDQVSFEHSIVVGGFFGDEISLEIDVLNPSNQETSRINYNTVSLSATGSGDGSVQEVDYQTFGGSGDILPGGFARLEVWALATLDPLERSDLEIFARDTAYRDWAQFTHVPGGIHTDAGASSLVSSDA